MQTLGAVAQAVGLAIDEGDRAARQEIGVGLAEEVVLVGVEYGGGVRKRRLIGEVREAQLGRAIEHGADPAHPVGHRPEVRGVLAIEVLLNVEAEAWQPGTQGGVNVAPVLGEGVPRQAIALEASPQREPPDYAVWNEIGTFSLGQAAYL